MEASHPFTFSGRYVEEQGLGLWRRTCLCHINALLQLSCCMYYVKLSLRYQRYDGKFNRLNFFTKGTRLVPGGPVMEHRSSPSATPNAVDVRRFPTRQVTQPVYIEIYNNHDT